MILSVEPASALIDVPRIIKVTGAEPGAEVAIHLDLAQGDGSVFSSDAVFQADASGEVDLTQDAPLRGCYAGVSGMGLVWSATRQTEGDPFAAGIAPSVGVLRAGDAIARFTQSFMAEGVERQEVRAEGLVGTLFLPPGAGPHPAVIVVNGSGGGVNEARAALYAAHGFAALALGYFRAPGLSPYISNTRLEYFATALDWVRATVRPLHGFVALSGQSRGGELALLLGATFPGKVSAVVGYVPGAAVHGAMSAADPALGRDAYAWLLDGKPVPHVWEGNRTATWAPYDTAPEPKRHAMGVSTALDDPEAVARARIRVERIRGPVMVLSGTDDGSWPSSRYGDMIMDALRDHPWPTHHLRYEGAGHFILYPHVPTTETTRRHPVRGTLSTFGGTPEGGAQANADSWPRVVAFLREAVLAGGRT